MGYLMSYPNAYGCYDPQCLDSTWDHDCPRVPDQVTPSAGDESMAESLGIGGPEGWSVDQEITQRDAQIASLIAERDTAQAFLVKEQAAKQQIVDMHNRLAKQWIYERDKAEAEVERLSAQGPNSEVSLLRRDVAALMARDELRDRVIEAARAMAKDWRNSSPHGHAQSDEIDSSENKSEGRDTEANSSENPHRQVESHSHASLITPSGACSHGISWAGMDNQHFAMEHKLDHP